MEAPKTEAPNPFPGQGGAYYINPKGSNTLKRDRNADVPFGALTKVEQYERIKAIPASLISERDREARISALGLTDVELAQASAPVVPAAPPAPVADAAATVTKSKGAK